MTASFDLFTRVRKFFFRHQKVDSGATNSGSPALATRLSDPDFLSVLRLKPSCCRCQQPPGAVTSATVPATVAQMTVCSGAAQQGRPAKSCQDRTTPWSRFPPFLPRRLSLIAPHRHLPSSRSLSRCVKMPQRFGKLVMSFFSFNNCIK